MFDISTVNKRFFEIKLTYLDENENIHEIKLDVEPPKLKTLKKILHLSKNRSEEAMDELVQALQLILNKNKSGYVVSVDVLDELDFDEMNEVLTRYFEWLTKEKSSPN